MKAGLPSRPERGSALDGVVRVDVQFGGQVIRPVPDASSGPEICVPALSGFGKRPIAPRGARRLQVFPEERARVRERAPARLEPRVPERPSMDHVRPDFEGRGDVGRAGRGGEADRVVEQGLGRTDLDQGRRQSLEIGVERREARVFPVHSRRRKGVGQLLQISLLNERIDRALARERRPRHGEIDPRRHEPETAGQVLARALELPGQGERQIRARAVAADRNLFAPRSRRWRSRRQTVSASSRAAGKGCSGARR